MSNESINVPPGKASQQPLRVLLMAGSMEAGGSERQTLLLLRHLDRKVFQPSLFLRHRRGAWLQEIPDDVRVVAYDAGEGAEGGQKNRTQRFNWPGRELRRQIRFLADWIVRERIDVVYDRTFHMTMLAGPARNRTGIPHVSTIVNLPEHAFPLFEKKYRWLKKRRLVNAYRNAAQVVAVSSTVARAAESFYALPAGSITAIPNPLDEERISAEAKQSAPWAPASDQLNLVCVARLDEQKGHADLLHALAGLTTEPWHLWLLGAGPLRAHLESLVHHLGLSHRVTFLGHVDRVAASVSQSQLLVLPSRFEGMPNVVLEAMMLGVPVVATEAGGTGDLLQAGRLGKLVPAANPTALRNAIAGFFSSPEGYLERAKLAQAAVTREHSIERIVPQIAEILQRAAKGG